MGFTSSPKDAETAADCALELQRAISELPLASLGLPQTLGLRLGGHFGPVFQLHDPVIGRGAFMRMCAIAVEFHGDGLKRFP